MVRQAQPLTFALTLAIAMLAIITGSARSNAQQPPPATAMTSPATPPTLPETPVGKIMASVLKSIASTENPIPAELFNEAFQKQVPPDKVKELCAQLIGQNGPFALLKINQAPDANKMVVTVKGTTTNQKLQVVLGLDKEGKIETLLFRPAADTDLPPFASWSELDTALTALGGKVNFGAYLLTEAADAQAPGNVFTVTPVHTFNPELRLALGSTFKLYVLGALGEAVASGKIKWDEPLPIKTEYKSLPSGTMQDEPEGKAFPVSLFAQKMISISDNTATDHLIRRVGRDAVEEYMARLHGKPTLNYPFLTTREMFALKLSSDTTLMPRWNSLGEAQRRDMVVADDPVTPSRRIGPSHQPGEVANTNPELAAASKWTKPRYIDTIEWFSSPDELARLFADLHRLELQPGLAEIGRALRLNPGLPLDTETWTGIAFKGGSEPGVLNLSWMLTHTDGRILVVTVGWNNTRELLDDNKLLELAPRAIGLLAKPK